MNPATLLTRISHPPSSRDAERTRSRKTRPGFPAGLYNRIPPKENPDRNEAGTGRSQSQQKGYEKGGLALTKWTALFLWFGPCLVSVQAIPPLVFNTTTPVNDLKGTLAAEVKFAQSQILPAHPREGDNQPHLTASRKTLLLVRPVNPDDTTPLMLVARDGKGTILGNLTLDPPSQLPKTAYFVEGAPEEIDYRPPSGTTGLLRDGSDLEQLNDPLGAFLLETLDAHALVEIETADGRWVSDIFLPEDKELDGKVARTKSEAGYRTTIHYSGRLATLARGQSFQFKCVKGQWFRDGDLDNNAILYAENTWSGLLPAEWIVPGLALEFRQGNQSGILGDLTVGAPSQLLIHTIDLGMLTTPRGKFEFADDPEAHREYFQTVPVSRLIVAQYAPLSLREVMMPNGELLREVDESEGGWHTGRMRQSIGKELISHGIDNANYGLHSTAGQGERSHPYVAAQLAAHNSRGNYSNGIQVHGGSGGGGIVTLDSTLGNEFSHEVGHNYGLGHFVDGFKGSVHRSADQINSTWGWDADKNRLIPNFYPTRSGQDTCLDNECQAPFDGRSFGKDAMAGGSPFSGFNRFTLYTPNTAAIIQRFLENKAIFDPDSPTGFSKWNADTAQMEPYHHQVRSTRETTAPGKDLTEERLVSLLAEHDLVRVAMADGNWTRGIPLPPASPANRGRLIAIDHEAGYNSTLFLNGREVTVSRGTKSRYRSDGKQWNEVGIDEHGADRRPLAFGVPVVTLVGYYDPVGPLPSYFYPALHGAFGYCYEDDSERLNESDTELQVETATGLLRFRLSSQRLGEGLAARLMNKFHVNIPEASRPIRASLLSRGKVLAQTTLSPVSGELSVTVNGIPLTPQNRASGKPALSVPRTQ